MSAIVIGGKGDRVSFDPSVADAPALGLRAREQLFKRKVETKKREAAWSLTVAEEHVKSHERGMSAPRDADDPGTPPDARANRDQRPEDPLFHVNTRTPLGLSQSAAYRRRILELTREQSQPMQE